ncbi:MAG TPA: hypothetical protein VGB72_00760 [Acidobacteriota bacterium]
MKNKRWRLVLISLIIGLLSLVYYLSYYRYLEVDVDEGLLIQGADRALDGQVPLKDFHQYMPGRYYLLAVWFLLFGKSVAVARLLLVLVHTLKNILMFHVARRLLPLPFSLIPVGLMMLLPGFWVKADISSVLLLNTLFLLKFLTPPHRTRHLVFLGLSVGFSVMFREDMAGYSFLTVAVVLLVKGILDRERLWSILRKGVLFSLVVLAALVPLLLLYISQGGLARLFQGILETVRLGHIESSPFPPPRAVSLISAWIFPYLAILLFMIMIPVLIFRFRRPPEEDPPKYFLLAVFVLAVLSFFHIWHWTHEFRIVQTGALIHILWATLIYLAFREAGRWARRGGRAGRAGSAGFKLAAFLGLAVQAYLIVFSFVAGYVVQFDAGGISLRGGVHRPITGTDRAGILPPIHTAQSQSRLVHYLNRFTSPRDTIYCFGESILYFLTGRKNATEFDNGRIPAYFPDQRRIFVSQLWGRKPKVIIVRDFEMLWWSKKMPEIFKAIKQDYFLDAELIYYYVFTRVTDLDPWIRRGNYLFWSAQVTQSAEAYWIALQKKRDHPELKKILSRFFFSRELAERCLPVLEGYAAKTEGNTWRLRWGSLNGRRFSGTVSLPGAGAISGVTVFPQGQEDRVKLTLRPGGVVAFDSELQGGSAGLDITLSDPALMGAIRFDLRVDGKKAEFVFLNERGLIPADEVVPNAPVF